MSNPAETQERAPEAPEVQAPVAPVVAEAPNQSRASDVDKQLSEIEIRAIADSRAAEIANAEIQRREDLRAYGTRFNIPAADVDKAIKDKRSLDQFKVEILERVANSNPAYSTGRVEVTSEPLKKGSRQYLNSTWAESAKRALGERGKNLVIPTYAETEAIKRHYLDSAGLPFHRSLEGSLTLADKIAIDEGIGAPIIDETVGAALEMAVFPVDTISGDSVSLSVQVGNPSIAFRNANEGSNSKKGTFASRLFETSILEEFINVDIQGVLNASKDPARVLTGETRSVTKAVLSHAAFQSWYAGTTQSGADEKASPGILAQSNTAATHVLDATGTTSKTSIWILELGVGELDHVYGNDTTLMFGDDWIEQTVQDDNGKSFRALQNWISGRFTPRLANKNRAIRIKNVSAETGHTATDALIASALQLAEELGMQPNAIFGTPRSRAQIRTSRSAYHPTGQPVPQVDDVFGIPFYSTLNLSNAETV